MASNKMDKIDEESIVGTLQGETSITQDGKRSWALNEEEITSLKVADGQRGKHILFCTYILGTTPTTPTSESTPTLDIWCGASILI